MRTLFVILFLVWSCCCKAQDEAYGGGPGSGSTRSLSPFVSCTLFSGGIRSGFDTATTAPLSCFLYAGGIADGAAVNTSALTSCPPFFGGLADGFDSDGSVCLITLPVRLLSFYGTAMDAVNQLHWDIADGADVQQFIPEKRNGAGAFARIGVVANNGATHFSFADNNPQPVNYYRLRIEERGGVITYSNIILLRRKSSEAIQVYPNPADNKKTVLYYRASQQSLQRVDLIYPDGRVARSFSYLFTRGENQVQLDLSACASGIYLLRVGNSVVGKIIVP